MHTISNDAIFFQNVQSIVPCVTMRLNVMNVHKASIWMKMENVKVRIFHQLILKYIHILCYMCIDTTVSMLTDGTPFNIQQWTCLFQNVQSIVRCVTMRQNVMSVLRVTILLNMENVYVRICAISFITITRFDYIWLWYLVRSFLSWYILNKLSMPCLILFIVLHFENW